MAEPRRGSIRILSGTTTLECMVKNWERYQAAQVQPITNPTGELSYEYANPTEAITVSFEDFSLGAGAFIHKPGRYSIARNRDCRRAGYVIPGPREEADVTGIAANQRVVGNVRHSNVNWVITQNGATAAGKAYRIEAGVWAEKRNFAAVAPTGIVSFKGAVVVFLGSGTAFDFSTDDGSTWTASTKTGSAKNGNIGIALQNAQTAPRVLYLRNNNETYFSSDMTNAGAATTGSTIGDDTQDEWNGLAEDQNGVVLMCKRRYLYTMDSDNNGRIIAGPFKYYASSDSGATQGGANGKYMVQIDGRIFIGPIEDYFILEYDHGLLQRIDPGVVGNQIPRMQLPINSMTKVGRELVVAMGSVNSGTLKDVTQSPAGNALLGNTFTTKSDLWFGRYVELGDGGSPRLIWHGVLLECSDLVGWMWYDDGANNLNLGNSENAAVNLSQRTAYVTTVDPLGSATGGAIKLSQAQGELESGLYTQSQPNIIKTARRMETRASGLAAGITLTIRTRVAEDDVNTAFTALNTAYTSAATARTGTAFPASTTFRGIRVNWLFSSVAASTYAILYNSQLIHLHYPASRDILEFDIIGVKGQRLSSGALSTNTLKQIRDFVTTWKDATDPATVTDLETGDTWNMRIEPGLGGFKESGDGPKRAFHLIAHEVV